MVRCVCAGALALALASLAIGGNYDVEDIFLPWQAADKCIAPMEVPPPRSDAESRHRAAVDDMLQRFWKGRSGYHDIGSVPPRLLNSHPDSEDARHKALTYGEITALGVRQLAHAMGIDTGEPVAFMDLGSGVGKLVAQVYLEWASVHNATGVELSPMRAALARSAWKSFVADSGSRLGALRRGAFMARAGTATSMLEKAPFGEDVSGYIKVGHVIFLEGDFLAVDVREASHIFVASLCFSDALLNHLTQKLAAEAVRLRVLATLRLLPHGLEGFELERSTMIESSWERSFGTRVHIYVRHDT